METSYNKDFFDQVSDVALYYRRNPHRFAHDYLRVDLRLFQQILLVMMNYTTTFAMIGARGIGKTFLSAIYCCIRAILYPGTKIVIASGTRGQALNVLEKIMLELRPNSPELASEIDERQTRINGTNAQIVFKNTSYIKVVTASDSARGNRANILLLDEFRLIPKDIVDMVLKKFLTQRRMPRYADLTPEERMREYEKEKNVIVLLSSAYTTDSWAYTKCLDIFHKMCSGVTKQFVCGLPYQLAIAEGLIDQDTIADEMEESDFSELKFQMEYEALWWGNIDGSFFDFDTISKNRKIKYAIYPNKLSAKLGGAQNFRIMPKQNGEVRIISADIALMSSRKHDNDATAIFINQMLPTKAGRYSNNIIYTDVYEGLRTDSQALIIRQLFDEYSCDYLVLDTNGIGLGLYDYLAQDIVDRDTGEVYPAISCCNNAEMASRCVVPGAEKVIWSIKASAQFNSDCAYMLREGFRSGRIRLLCMEEEAEKNLAEIKGYSTLSPAEQMQYKLPYINTSLLVDELTKLQHEESGGKVRVYERAGMRKDRYSSLAYNYYVAMQLENRINKKRQTSVSTSNLFIVKPPNYSGKAASATHGKRNSTGWQEYQ